MPDVMVRIGSEADLAAIARFDPQVFDGSERWQHLLDLEEHGRGTVVVATLPQRREVAGYVVIEPTAFFGRDFIELLVVDERWRRHGIGRDLLQTAFDRCATNEVFTSTNESNAPMRTLLDHNGWSVSGVLQGLDAGDPEWIYFRRRTP